MLDDTMLRQAVYIGKQPGEPSNVIRHSLVNRLGEWLVGSQSKRGLADPKLEALRALSAAVSRSPTTLDDGMLAIARDAGLRIADLNLLIPTYDWRALREIAEGEAVH